MSDKSYPLSDEQIAAFRNDGALCLRRVFTPAEVERLRGGVDEAMENPGPFSRNFSGGDGDAFFADVFVWTRVAQVKDVTLTPRLAEIAGRLMGAREVRFFFDHLLVKEPGAAEPTPWHQDSPYWPIAGSQCCSIWIAMDRVTRDNGLVEYVRGTHSTGKEYAPKSFHGDGRLSDRALEEIPDIDADRSAFDLIAWDLEPGDVAIHDFRTIHGAPGNETSTRRRRGLATRWVGEDIVYQSRSGVPEPMSGSLAQLAPGLCDGAPLDHPAFPLVWNDPATPRSADI